MDPISIEEKVHHGDVWTVPAKGTLKVMGWKKNGKWKITTCPEGMEWNWKCLGMRGGKTTQQLILWWPWQAAEVGPQLLQFVLELRNFYCQQKGGKFEEERGVGFLSMRTEHISGQMCGHANHRGPFTGVYINVNHRRHDIIKRKDEQNGCRFNPAFHVFPTFTQGCRDETVNFTRSRYKFIQGSPLKWSLTNTNVNNAQTTQTPLKQSHRTNWGPSKWLLHITFTRRDYVEATQFDKKTYILIICKVLTSCDVCPFNWCLRGI